MPLLKPKQRSVDPLKFDPSQTVGLRRAFAAEITRRIEAIRRAAVDLILKEDAFGLKGNDVTFNFNPYHLGPGPHGGQFTTKEKGEVEVTDDSGDEPNPEVVRKAAEATGINKDNVHEMLGVPHDAGITIKYEHEKTYSLAKIQARGTHPLAGHYNLERSYEVHREVPNQIMSYNLKAVHNELFETEKQGTGFGLEVFHNQVQQASAAGYERIETTAAGSAKEAFNGYYTWPRLGYDTSVSALPNNEKVQEVFPNAKKLSDLMKTPFGREWWKKNGRTTSLEFDLTEGSLSRKVLDAYVKEKQSRATATTNRRGRGDTRLSMGRGGLTRNTRWKFRTDADKIEAFKEWLDDRINRSLLQTDEVNRVWTKRYIEAAYRKGLVRGTTQAAKLRRRTYESFLRDTSKQRKRLETLLKRSLNDLEGFSSKMKTDATRIIADGLNRKDSATKVARDLSKALDISKARARTIARTEMVHAQAEGQLDAFEAEGITHVSALVEWVTAAGQGATAAEMKEAGVCPQCQAVSGIVLTIDEARGLIPRHPNCRCGWEAVADGDNDADRKATQRQIAKAIRRSVRAERKKGGSNWAGSNKVFKTKRMKPVRQRKRRR